MKIYLFLLLVEYHHFGKGEKLISYQHIVNSDYKLIKNQRSIVRLSE